MAVARVLSATMEGDRLRLRKLAPVAQSSWRVVVGTECRGVASHPDLLGRPGLHTGVGESILEVITAGRFKLWGEADGRSWRDMGAG